MPRLARLDAPGLLHHVMIRGIELRPIVIDTPDREDFLAWLARLLPDTQTTGLAWARMPTPIHLLLRPGAVPLAPLMRRLLTGSAVRFNHRHHRKGLLFQNRYQSVVCQAAPHCAELSRDIHLHPLRATMVPNLAALTRELDTDQSAMMGDAARPWQATAEVLPVFAQTVTRAQKAYGASVEAGIGPGRRADLTGGGLVRSLGGWAEVLAQREKRRGPIKSDERILGATEFVEDLLRQAEAQYPRPVAWTRWGVGFEPVLARVGALCGLPPAWRR